MGGVRRTRRAVRLQHRAHRERRRRGHRRFLRAVALGLGLFVAFGTIVGRRRDHVPRLSALFGWSFAAGAEPEEAWLIRVETGDARELSMKVRDLEYRYPIDPGWVAALLSLRRRHTFTI